jgi:hypothetical protein
MRTLVICDCVNALGIADDECERCLGTGECDITDEPMFEEFEESAGMEPVAGAAGAPEI